MNHQKNAALIEPLLIPQQKGIHINTTKAKTDQNNVRMKVLMTKKEAEKLLSKCTKEGNLKFKDVFNQLITVPPQCVEVISFDTSSKYQDDKKLYSISEEEEFLH